MTDILSISCEIVLRLTPQKLVDDESILVQGIAFLQKITSANVNQDYVALWRHEATCSWDENLFKVILSLH